MQKDACIKHSILGVISLLVVLVTSFTGMFWDNVTQIYKLSEWLYATNLFNFVVPNTFDPGIPLTVPFLHAAAWKLLGKNLLVSHLLMWPFVWGFLWQLYRLVHYFFQNKQIIIWVFALVIFDPSLCSALSLINYEVVQYFLFFGAINAVFRRETTLKTLFLIFLSIISLRSMMLCASVFIFDTFLFFLLHKRRINQISFKQDIMPYLAGAIPAICFLVWHYSVKKWVFGNADSPWAECGTLVNFQGFITNIIILIHRQLDFGRIFLWIYILIILIINRKLLSGLPQRIYAVAGLWVASMLIVGGVSLMINNPMGHRYFIASYIITALFTGLLIEHFYGLKRWLFAILTILLITGNLWVYPPRIAQGWDSTLGHLPYWYLRREMIHQMDDMKIPIDSTASFFPNYNSIESIDLNGDQRQFSNFTGTEPYVLMSNVYNLSDNDYDLLDTQYKPIKILRFYPVNVTLYLKLNR